MNLSSLLSGRAFVGVDEGRDRIFRVDFERPEREWTRPLPGKCRSLQRIDNGHILAVEDTGYAEIDPTNGREVFRTSLGMGGIVSAMRLTDGSTFVGALTPDSNQSGIRFVLYDHSGRPAREAVFPGNYVRLSTLTPTDTILFTQNDRVLEGDWSGRILREFKAPGFRHAWKACRLPEDRTLITAGYGAFAVEFDSDGRELRRWTCNASFAAARPHFFADFHLMPEGSLIVSNWHGHGPDLGGTGYGLIEFAPDRTCRGAWRDPARVSSLQAFVLIDP